MVFEKGLDEKNRLCTLAGLNIKYKSEISNKVHNAIQAEKKETKN